jgi:hypothetical protein
MNIDPAAMIPAENPAMPLKFVPPCAFKMAPAIGVPVNPLNISGSQGFVVRQGNEAASHPHHCSNLSHILANGCNGGILDTD